ncbi:dolichyl-diphosphooligosaccharide--protein glycosyltransferase subunit STT3B-like [Convolutriloba macropyga]|uniref:dolichyl-diphosphooligosaccharide--protein glycosyltransferase subunit STT3B-like n=1 Tax=Convolutriloba macropyga TaxID=536237 RepID=UPI003F528895
MSGEDMFKQISSRNGAGAPTYSASLSSSYASEVGHFGKGNSSKALNEKKIANAAERLLVVVILAICCIEGFISRLFAVIRFESIIHEFDPWFNYRATSQLVENGWYQFLNWFDDRAWYPLGRIVGGTVYPGLMITSGLIHLILNGLNFTVHIRDVCVFLAPLFSGLTAIAAYFLTKEIWSKGAGLLAACFMCIVPGYISRSVAGSYDNEGIAIFALLITYYFWIKSLKTGSVMWACITALSYMYMVSAWGGYVFITNLVPLHAFVLVLMQRYSHRLYVAFSVWFIMGLLLSMQVPFVGFQPVRTSEHMAAAGTFLLLQAYAFLAYLKTKVSSEQFKALFVYAVIVSAGCVFTGVVALTYLGYIAPWSGRFYSLWDTGYAKIHIPIIASVSEHQPTTWVSFFFDLHILVCAFPAGIWFCIKRVNDERVFIVLYAVFASYFAGVMVRLILTLTPVVCIGASIIFSESFSKYIISETNELAAQNAANDEDDAYENGSAASPSGPGKKNKKLYDKAGKVKPPKEKEEMSLGTNLKSVTVFTLLIMLLLFAVHCTWVTSSAYSSPSVVLASQNNDGSRNILDDFREAYYWLRRNTAEDARVMSWWDYGYQIAGFANRTTLVDNNTWNNSHIAMVGKAMSSNESRAYEIMRSLDVDYVLVIFGGLIGYSGDDINKFLWMVRIAEGEHPQEIKESNYFSDAGSYRVDNEASDTMLNCLMYLMSYYRFGEVQLDFRMPAGYDRTRGAEIGRKDISFKHMEEAFTSEHWLVRIFKVKPLDNRIPALKRPRFSKLRKNFRYISKKTDRKKKGFIKNKSSIVRGTKAPAAPNGQNKAKK